MRSIWNGAISFGLVSIPIKLVNATESRSVSFRQIHTQDGGRIRYRKVCELDDQEVPQAEIGKAYEDADGTMIPITDEDLASLPLPTTKTIDIVAFVPASEIDPLQIDGAYYLAANGVPAAKPYTLLREALKRSKKVGLAKFALRGRERLGMLRVVDDVIAMHGLLWPDEVRRPEGVAPDADVAIRDAELDLADALMDTLGDVDVDSLHDDYRQAVEELIAAKAEGVALEPQPAPAGGGRVIDLMAALESSVRAAKEARGDEAAEASAPVAELKPRGKAAAGRKASKRAGAAAAEPAPGRTAAGRAPAGKASGGRAPAERVTARGATAKGATAKGANTGKPAPESATSSRQAPSEAAAGKTAGKTAGRAAGKTAAGKSAGRRRAS
ncbi:non-homologous end joining protein Ku [Streptomyces pacificus]|uniref:Non-homologous end joining protein Ku n=1 Tax=Streptomyces pacificus TaxID=2705029 RepID=A0A6A0AW23_9ACTN|nr:Ku protein [Streptomyces pacificus]GFH35787.1 Ku protein [Streptomyces pacificus]